jgi:hypothetical protein
MILNLFFDLQIIILQKDNVFKKRNLKWHV